ncbi:hypothetical protein NDU88_006829 [Pleurodeles waltl]|uniref:Uncharacterized protein n=1 Tax=Pleurodeles waltl TaxID=8319 RepID=A0AAV7N204_PLEWA|nr:hypothetical protein NDU88_006829 [Pleurodeles waltl]
MLEEWAENSKQSSLNMKRILIKYAIKDRSKILEEIDKIRLELLTIITQEALDDFMKNLEKKLTKLEEDIPIKKQRKFIRDFKDYQAGRILTFHRKYDHMYKEEVSELSLKNLETTEVSTEELVESDVSDGYLSDISDTTLLKDVVVDKGTERSNFLKQFRLLNQGRTDQYKHFQSQRGRGGGPGGKRRGTGRPRIEEGEGNSRSMVVVTRARK